MLISENSYANNFNLNNNPKKNDEENKKNHQIFMYKMQNMKQKRRMEKKLFYIGVKVN